MMLCTFYTHSPGPLADGTRYNNHSFFCAAPSRFKLGEKLRIKYYTHQGKARRSIDVVVRDRGCGHIDLNRAAFYSLVGGYSIGHVQVKVQRLN